MVLTEEQIGMLLVAARRARGAVAEQLGGTWCDALVAVYFKEWHHCKLMLTGPM